MSQNRKNNHYHYAEKFEAGRSRRGSAKTANMPFKALIISLIVLVMFGLVCTTFGAYVTENEPEYDSENPGIITEVRNLKNSRDIAVTGADVDLASTGGNVSGGTVVVEVPSSWTSYSHIQFGLYQNGYLWCSADMTRISNTNFYYGSNPTDHGSWSNEQIMFMANNSHFGSGSFDGTNSAKYSGKITQAMSSNYYTFWLSGSANAYTNTYKGNFDSLANAVYVYDQTAYIYTSTTGSAASNYSSNGAGGNVTITASWLDADNNQAAQTTTPSSNGATSVTYERAVYHTSVTYNATANSGYRFVGWFSSTSATTADSTNASYTYTSSLTGAKTLYARFIKTYTVSITQSPSAYTGTAPTLTGGGTTGSSITVDAGTSVTMNSNVSNTGITCTFRNGGTAGAVLSGNQTITSNTSIYACYTLSAPTISAFSYDTTVEGAAAITPSKTASSSANPAGTLSYSYSSITGGTGPTNSSSLNVTSGAFSATVAGTYKVRVTVTDTCSGLTATATRDATVTVKPAPVSGISYTVTGEDSGAGTFAEPWKVPINSTSFTITSYIPDDGSRDPNYLYTWTRTDGTYLISDGTITNGSNSAAASDVYTVTDTSGAANTDVIHNTMLVDTQGYIYKVAVTKTRNNVTSDPYYVTFYYGVTKDFLVVNHFDFRQFNSTAGEEVQKIYSEDSGINYIDADYNAGGDHFHTVLNFSKDNIIANKVAVWTPSQFTITTGEFAGTHTALPNDSSHSVYDLITHISTIARNNANLMSTAGPKWFKAYIDDYQNANIGAVVQPLHTTVGTSSTVAHRPIYFVDQALATGVNVNSRVMAFFLEASDETAIVHYQTGQTVPGRSDTYRFYIPADATYLTFAYVADNNYVIPSVDTSDGVRLVYTGYGSAVLKAWSPTIDLNAGANAGMTTFVADTHGNATDGIYNYTNTADGGYMTTLQ